MGARKFDYNISKLLQFKGGKIPPPFAREVLKIRFAPSAQRRLSALLEKNQQGTITPDEYDWLSFCIRLGDVMDLLQAEAMVALLPMRKRKRAAS